MSKKEINVIGILIDTKYKNLKLYQVRDSWEHNEREGSYSNKSASGFSSVDGLQNILSFLSFERNPATQFVIVYDVSCPKKEELIKIFLSKINEIKKNDRLPSLVSIGHEEAPLSEDITGLVSLITEVTNTETPNELLKNIVGKKVIHIKKEIEFSSNLETKQKAFTSQLNVILDKAKQLRKDEHLIAADKADELHRNLIQRSQTYFSNPTEETYITFKRLSKDDIEKAHEELDKHRGWKRVLGNIGLAILGFGILYLIAVAINRNIFFNKTDSSEKLDRFEQLIGDNIYQMKSNK